MKGYPGISLRLGEGVAVKTGRASGKGYRERENGLMEVRIIEKEGKETATLIYSHTTEHYRRSYFGSNNFFLEIL